MWWIACVQVPRLGDWEFGIAVAAFEWDFGKQGYLWFFYDGEGPESEESWDDFTTYKRNIRKEKAIIATTFWG